MPRENKADNAEKLRRIRTIQEWLLQGHSSTQIVATITSKWDLSERQGYRYVSDAYGQFKEDTKEKSKARKAYHLAARQRLLQKVLDRDPGLALKVLQDMGKLEGMYAPKRLNHTTKGDKLEAGSAIIKLSNGTELTLD